jgi:putative ABC transport system ATP-binding protein
VPAPALEAVSLARVFPGPPRVEALREATFTVERGEVAAIMGRSGSGKSTLLNLLGLLDRPTRGELKIGGLDAAPLGERGRAKLRAKSIGFVFQSFHLVGELTALQNTALPLLYSGCRAAQRARRAAAALEQLGMAGRMDATAATLSGGEKQRVALARASVQRPAVILADEPTGNLDAASEQMVLELLVGLAHAGSAVVLVTHNPQVAAAATVRYLMDDGVLSRAPALDGLDMAADNALDRGVLSATPGDLGALNCAETVRLPPVVPDQVPSSEPRADPRPRLRTRRARKRG